MQLKYRVNKKTPASVKIPGAGVHSLTCVYLSILQVIFRKCSFYRSNSKTSVLV